MRRIVPHQARLHDGDEVKRLIDAGFIGNQLPRPDATGVMQPFRELLAAYGPELQERFSIDQSHTWPEDPYTAARNTRGQVDTALAYVFDEKIDLQLLSELFGYRLVTQRAGDPHWIGMHPRIAGLYMTALAEGMAPMLGAHPLTDQALDHVAVSGFTMERLAAALLDLPEGRAKPTQRSREIEQAMVTLAFKNVVPADPASIPATKIIAFRKQYAEERGLFQAEVDKLTRELAYLDQVDDPAEFTRHLENVYAKNLAPRLARLQRELRRANIDTVEAVVAMSVALPSVLSWAIAPMGVPSAGPAGAALGIAFAAWRILRSRRKTMTSALHPSAQAYLYHAGRVLTPVELTNEIYARSRLFGSQAIEPS